ncbi:MAG: trehalose-phosphatase [Acidimicrobiia bacterium]|nr:trehalose-phosphatase [Acidimicrobiia bacterium]
MSRGLDILAKRHRSALAGFVTPGTLLAFDFDGTLAPIVADRDRARMRASTRRLLERLAARARTVVASGRQLADLAPRVAGVPLAGVFGGFGHEPAPAGLPDVPIATWVRHLERALAGLPGIAIEQKPFAVSVHFRAAPDPAATKAAIKRAARELPLVRIVGGLATVNLLPDTGVHKGTTVERARRELGCDRVLYVGDDATDEEVFRHAPASRLLGIRVGMGGESRARYRLREQRAIDDLLRALLSLSSLGRPAS